MARDGHIQRELRRTARRPSEDSANPAPKPSIGPLLWWILFLFTARLWAADIAVSKDLEFITENENWMSKEGKAAWHRRLRETPDITAPLVELFWKCLDDPSDLTGAVVNALMERTEIPATELDKLSRRLRRLAVSAPVSRLSHEQRSTFATMCLLQRSPTRENEDLALLLLQCDDSHVRFIAATTLGWIGSARSVEPMRQHFDLFRYRDTRSPEVVTYHFEAEEMLLARLAGKPWDAGSLRSSLPANTAKLMAPKASVPDWIASRTAFYSTVVLTLTSASSLFWLLVMKRRPSVTTSATKTN